MGTEMENPSKFSVGDVVKTQWFGYYNIVDKACHPEQGWTYLLLSTDGVLRFWCFEKSIEPIEN